MESESCPFYGIILTVTTVHYYLLKLDLICGLDFWELLFLALLRNHAYNYANSLLVSIGRYFVRAGGRRERGWSATSAWLCKHGTLYPQSVCSCIASSVDGSCVAYFRNYFFSKPQKSCGLKIFISILMFNKLPSVSWDVANPVWMLLAHGKCKKIWHNFACGERWLY